jgi:methylated-DNA-[protein]-cysteine S-methyltransferase
MNATVDINEIKYCSLFNSSQGAGAVVATERGVFEVFLTFSMTKEQELKERIARCYPEAVYENDATKRAALLLADYFAGKNVIFDLPLDRRRITPFQSAVYYVVSEIPYGCVRSYKEIAEKMGRPKSARGVGNAMAANPFPIIVPCHRVVGSSGKLTGYSAPGGIESKKWLLEMERASRV